MSETPAAACEAATALLAEAGVEEPRREARLLFLQGLGWDLAEFMRRQRDPLAAEDAARYAAIVSRRAAREPAALILGHREFWSLDFLVSPDTLIPRPDSETIIEAALSLASDGVPPGRLLDLGTGTGCLLLAALSEFGGATGVGVDRAPAAARLAARNAARLGLAGRAGFIAGDWASAIAGRFDLILSNPPYIPTSEIATLAPEVARHEPASALDGGTDGLDAYRHLFADLDRLLAVGGHAVLEFGLGQDHVLPGLAEAAGLRVLGLRSDLAGHPRVIIVGRMQKEVGFAGGPH